MYSVIKSSHERYGSVIEIVRDENGTLMTPSQARQQASKEKQSWQDVGILKVRYLVDGQVMTIKQVEHWAHEEYKNLPKCNECAKVLGESIYTHQLSGTELFCTQSCADKNYIEEASKFKNEEEIDYL